MDVTSYLLGKQSGGGTPINNQNKNITITENGTTTVSADAGYTGLGTVGITANVQPNLESKSVTITENGTTTVTPTTGKDGLSQVSITTNVSGGGDLSEYFGNTIGRGYNNEPYWAYIVKKIPGPLTASNKNLSYAFQSYRGTIIPQIVGTSSVTNMSSMFDNCSNVVNIDLSSFDTSSVTTMNNMFSNCTNLESITFGNNFNTENVTNFGGMFQYSFKNSSDLNLTLDLSKFDFKSATTVQNMFDVNGNNYSIKGLIWGTNLGKGYLTGASANTPSYTLNLSKLYELSHNSLMSVINNLYDIASAGVQPQRLVLGANNLSKLSQAEIDIATNKGWTVS